MSNVSIAEFSMERYLQDIPNVILYEIFRKIPKGRLIEISKLCSEFRDIAGDRRLWKDVYIEYIPNVVYTFKELYSEPWPVKLIDLRCSRIKPPVFSQTDQVVKVSKLLLSLSTADEVTMEAILTKYQCTELYLRLRWTYSEDHVFGIEPEVLLKQTSLEVLSLVGVISDFNYHNWLTPVLIYCKKLKSLDLRDTILVNLDVLSFVKNLPTSLEKLFLPERDSERAFEDSFFNMLAESFPNLRELGLSSSSVKCSSLLEFQFLEILHVFWNDSDDIKISDFHKYLVMFPALKTVYIVCYYLSENLQESLGKLLRTLEPRGIFVRLVDRVEKRPSGDDIFWRVSKIV